MIMKKRFLKRGIAGALAGILCTALLFPGNTAAAKSKTFDPDGVYHAALGIQTCTQVWMIRFAYFDKKANAYYGTDNAGKMLAGDPSGNGASYDGTFEDVEIKGNGTYTVKLTGADFSGETDISQLHVATDIPLNDTVKFEDVSFTVDGKKIATFDQGYMEDETPYLGGGMDLLLINHWRDGLIKELSSKGVNETADNGYALLQGTTGEEISVTFTVSGFHYDNPDATATEAPTKAPTKAPDKASSASSDKKSEEKGSSNIVPICIAGVVIILAGSGIFVIARRRK